MSLHKCERKSCPNHDKNGWCFNADGIHLKMNNVHLRSWSMAINTKDATLDSPPSTLPINLRENLIFTPHVYRNSKNTPKPYKLCGGEIFTTASPILNQM